MTPTKKLIVPVALSAMLFGAPTTTMYRCNLTRSSEDFFPNLTPEADLSACLKYLANTDFGFVHQVLTFTRRQNESITAASKEFNPHLLDNLISLKKYGPVYLTEREFQNKLEQVEGAYYRFLARSLLESKSRDFWDYHRKGWKAVPMRIDRARIAKYVAAEILNIIGNPKSTLGRVAGHFRRRK